MDGALYFPIDVVEGKNASGWPIYSPVIAEWSPERGFRRLAKVEPWNGLNQLQFRAHGHRLYWREGPACGFAGSDRSRIRSVPL